jgi:hypothetical protein
MIRVRTQAALELRSPFFWDVPTHCILLVVNGRFGTICRSDLRGSSSSRRLLKILKICLIPREWTDRLSRNVGQQLPTYAVQRYRRAKTSTTLWAEAWNLALHFFMTDIDCSYSCPFLLFSASLFFSLFAYILKPLLNQLDRAPSCDGVTMLRAITFPVVMLWKQIVTSLTDEALS